MLWLRELRVNRFQGSAGLGLRGFSGWKVNALLVLLVLPLPLPLLLLLLLLLVSCLACCHAGLEAAVLGCPPKKNFLRLAASLKKGLK